MGCGLGGEGGCEERKADRMGDGKRCYIVSHGHRGECDCMTLTEC